MSRSRRKAIIKDRPRNFKKSSEYWRTVRSRTNHIVRQMKYDPTLELPDEKVIVNDYDYSDYRFDHEYKTYPNLRELNTEYKEKLQRK